MNNIRRGFLYFVSAFFILFGVTGLFAPQLIDAQLNLMPVAIAGTSETRGLYGGGFAGFGVVIMCGLRCSQLASGLLLAMCIIMGGVVVGRLVSIGIDRELAFTARGRHWRISDSVGVLGGKQERRDRCQADAVAVAQFKNFANSWRYRLKLAINQPYQVEKLWL